MTNKEAFHAGETEFQLFLWNRIGMELETVYTHLVERCGCLWRQGKFREALDYGRLAEDVQGKAIGLPAHTELPMLLADCRRRLRDVEHPREEQK